MTPDRDDPILDVWLEEALGGRCPPDLTARILQAWAASGSDRPPAKPGSSHQELLDALRGAPMPPPLTLEPSWLEPTAPPLSSGEYHFNGSAVSPLVEPPIQEPPIQEATVSMSSSRAWKLGLEAAERRKSRRRNWAIATSVLAVTAVVGAASFYYQQSQPSIVASDDQGKKPAPTPNAVAPRNAVPKSPDGDVPPGNSNDELPPFVQPQAPPALAITPRSEWKDLVASTDEEIVSFINENIRSAWQAGEVTPSPTASDDEFCQRLTWQLLGRAATSAELAAFTADRSANKRVQLVDRVLRDEAYADELARHWAELWGESLAGFSTPDKLQSDRVAGLTTYLSKAFRENRPYNAIVYDLLSASGSNRPGSRDFNGATNFLAGDATNNAIGMTQSAARHLLGKQLQCAQCHDHPLGGAKEQQFWTLNAFFRQLQVQPDRAGGVRLVNRDAPERPAFFELPDGTMKAAYPEFFDGNKLPLSGSLADVDRRQALAVLVSGSDDMSRAAVNRLWANFFGYGFTRPADDMGPHNPPTHPELLERLAREFKAHGYQTKSLMRWVALSEPFGLTSKPQTGNLIDVPQLGNAPLFSHFYVRPVRAEQTYDSLVATAKIARDGGTLAQRDLARQAWIGQLARTLPVKGSSPPPPDTELALPVISSQHRELLDRIADGKLKPAEKIEHVFLAATGRKPTPREAGVAQQLIATHQGDLKLAFGDLWWALMNSREFVLGP